MVDNTGAIIYENKTITVSGVPSSTTGCWHRCHCFRWRAEGFHSLRRPWVQESRQQHHSSRRDTPTIFCCNSLESGGSQSYTRRTQINPPVLFNASKTIDFFAVVSDPAGVANLSAAVWRRLSSVMFSVRQFTPALQHPD